MSPYGLFSLWLRVLEQVSACMCAYLCVRASVCICVSAPVPSSSAGYWQSWQHVDYQTHRKLRPVGHQVSAWETSLPSEWWDNRERENVHGREREREGGREVKGCHGHHHDNKLSGVKETGRSRIRIRLTITLTSSWAASETGHI